MCAPAAHAESAYLRESKGRVRTHGAGLAVMASEALALSGSARYNTYAQRWLGNILGGNSWGASSIVGDGSTFPNCIQHQVANLAGALNGTPILWGAASEGPDSYTTSGTLVFDVVLENGARS